MSDFNSVQFTLLIAAAAATLITSAMGLLLFWQSRRGFRLLDDSRYYYEVQLRKVAERMTATQDRWEDANHLVINGQRRQSQELQLFDPREIPIFADHNLLGENLEIQPDLVFVLTSVLSQEEPVFDVIADTCRRHGLRAVRADQEEIPGDILRRIVTLIARSRVVVANISSRNANVYYELGIAHALGKPTILVSRTIEDVSFDVSANRVLTFRDTEELARKLDGALLAALRGHDF